MLPVVCPLNDDAIADDSEGRASFVLWNNFLPQPKHTELVATVEGLPRHSFIVLHVCFCYFIHVPWIMNNLGVL